MLDDGAGWFVAEGEAKTQVTVAHGELTSREEVEARKEYRGARLEALAASLKSTG